MTSLCNEIARLLSEVNVRRDQIKDDYIKAWLATFVSDVDLNAAWLQKNVRLVEQHHKPDKNMISKITWHLEKIV